MDYYDLILVLIPIALVTVTALLVVGGFTLGTAVPLAGFIAAGMIGHALFIRSPVDPTPVVA